MGFGSMVSISIRSSARYSDCSQELTDSIGRPMATCIFGKREFLIKDWAFWMLDRLVKSSCLFNRSFGRAPTKFGLFSIVFYISSNKISFAFGLASSNRSYIGATINLQFDQPACLQVDFPFTS